MVNEFDFKLVSFSKGGEMFVTVRENNILEIWRTKNTSDPISTYNCSDLGNITSVCFLNEEIILFALNNKIGIILERDISNLRAIDIFGTNIVIIPNDLNYKKIESVVPSPNGEKAIILYEYGSKEFGFFDLKNFSITDYKLNGMVNNAVFYSENLIYFIVNKGKYHNIYLSRIFDNNDISKSKSYGYSFSPYGDTNCICLNFSDKELFISDMLGVDRLRLSEYKEKVEMIPSIFGHDVNFFGCLNIICLTSSRNKLAIGTLHGFVYVIDSNKEKLIFEFKHNSRILNLKFSNDGSKIYSANRDVIKVHDLPII